MICRRTILYHLGWPLEWTDILIIFVRDFLAMLKHRSDPILWARWCS